jgi:hypothetical protein
MVPESMLPEGMQTSGTPQSRAADRNAYANREGPYANPDAPPPPEPNWAVRQMDEGYKQRTENASATVRDQIDQINQRPGAAENRSIAEQLKQNVPGFQPGIAKETGDQALLNLQGRLEGQATGNTLRDLQGNYDKSAQAIRDKFNSVTPAEPAPSPTPPQDVVANAAQQRVADAQSRVGIQQDATQNQLKIAADSLPDAERAASGAKLRDIHATAEQASSDKTTALRKAIANPETPIQVGDQTMTVNEALDRRAAINQETRKYQSTVGTVEGANKMDELAKERAALDKAIEGVNLPGMTEYRTYYRDTHVPQFEEGAGRDINRYDRFGYDKNKVPDEKVLAQFGGPNNISAAKQFTTVHGNNPEAVQLMADHQLGRLKSEAIDPATGALKQGSVDKFLSKNRELLDALPPQVREAVSAKNPDALYERLGQLEQRQKAIGDSKVAGILGQNPEKQLDAALNDWQVMRGVKRSVAKDPVADAALTRAIMARAPDPMDAAKFGSWLDGHDRVLRQVLTPDHLKALKDVAQAAEIQARLPRPTGAAEMPKSGLDKAGEQIGTPIKSLLQRNLAVAQGRVGAPYTAFDVATRAWNTYVSRETDAIWREALFNPDVAKTVAGAVKNQGFVKNKVNWLVNHFKTNGSPNAYLLTTGISDAQNDK